MNKKLMTAGILAGLIAIGGVAATVSAQTAAIETGLTEEQVIEIALTEVPGTVQEVELEREDGIKVFELEILAENGTEMEVEINADTGDILEVEAENDNHDCTKRDLDSDDA